jgi:PAS domain S-box-containing protein
VKPARAAREVDDADDLPSLLIPPERPQPQGEATARLDHVGERLVRSYLWATAAAFALFAAVLAVSPGTSIGPTWPVSALCAAVAVASGLAALLCRRWPRPMGVAGGLFALLGIGGAAVGLGWGPAAPAIGFAALHAALAMALTTLRGGLLVTGVALATVALLATGQHLGWYPATGSATGLPLVVLVQSLLILSAAAGGWLAARLVVGATRATDEREQRFRGLLRISADAYWELDAALRLTAVTTERSGRPARSADAAIGSIPWELPTFVCDPDVLDGLQADLGARQSFRDLPIAWRTRDGLQHFLVSGEPRFGRGGVFQGYWGVARDVTATLEAQHALLRTEARYHDLFVSIPNALVLHRDGRIVDANPAAVTLFGYHDLQEMVGELLLDSYEPGESCELARERSRQLQSLPPGESLPVAEFRLEAPGGRIIRVRATGVAVETDRGPAVLSIYVNDTERQAAEDAVRRSEALLSHLVASSPDVITLTEMDTGRYAMVNRSFERLTGWPADDVIGRTALDIGIWHAAEDRQRFVQQVRSDGRVQDMVVRFQRRDGSTVPMLISGARFRVDRSEYLVINARDMTEIERQRLEIEAILENASLGIALTRDQVFQMVNPAFEAMLGWPGGSIIGQPGTVVWPSRAAYAEIGATIGPRLANGEQVEIECDIRRRDGSTFLCRMLARAVDPSHPSRGGTIWVVEDITERRRLDEALARARDAAEAASRAKSAFLANTSHELRTPLNGLLGLAQLARTPGLDEVRRGTYLDQIVDSARSLADIVSDILDLSKIEAGRLTVESTPFDLEALLGSLERGYAALAAGRGLRLKLQAEPGLGRVQGDALRVRQILTNYLGNALKFTERGDVQLRARRVGSDRVRFEVLDTGPGIDAAAQARLFKPFTQADQSTTRRYGGTGLGLSICRELASLMGGEVGVLSRPGDGSCFWAELPLPAAPEDVDAPLPQLDPTATHGAHVLMVDDNEVNMMVAVAQLEQAGVRVGQAVDGRQALDAVAAAEAEGDPYDLVLMDLQMPVLSGYEVTTELRRRYTVEQLPIVAHTAAALVSVREQALAAGMNDFLPKPTPVELLRTAVARWARRRSQPAGH